METNLNAEEYEFYKAHLSLKELGTEGQYKLKKARVLLVGLGGLGSPCALYLASAGVGNLGLIDFDLVERSNLQRQIVYSNIEVGYPKVISAKKRLTEMNPYIN
ncbi:MAG: ThiF family adenylyltransferase, partial [Bacteriovoracaceae bacterium]|nr:ThiF family adenylyltransferase [Bacteriovoracaceae bacterium]